MIVKGYNAFQILVILLCFTPYAFAVVDAQKSYEAGIDAYENGQFIKAINLFEQSIEAGLTGSLLKDAKEKSDIDQCLMQAITISDIKEIKWLIANNANVNARLKKNINVRLNNVKLLEDETPLLIALKHSSDENIVTIIDVLLEAGAEPIVKYPEGKSTYKAARNRKQAEKIIKMLFGDCESSEKDKLEIENLINLVSKLQSGKIILDEEILSRLVYFKDGCSASKADVIRYNSLLALKKGEITIKDKVDYQINYVVPYDSGTKAYIDLEWIRNGEKGPSLEHAIKINNIWYFYKNTEIEKKELEKHFRIKVVKTVNENFKLPDNGYENTDLETILLFKILNNGEIKDIFFVERSGNRNFDEAAYMAIKKSNNKNVHPAGLDVPYVQIGLRFSPKGPE